MSLLLIAPERDMKPWKEALLERDRNLDVEIWPDVADKKRVQFAVCWNQPDHLLGTFPNLKTVSSLGAGTDHLLEDADLPDDVAICRVVGSSLVRQMQEYVLSAVLTYQRNLQRYSQQQRQTIWKAHDNIAADELTVGIMGLGAIGKPVARFLRDAGYPVRGWAASRKSIEGVDTFAGPGELEEFAGGVRVPVCLLPLTEKTSDILELELFRKLERPSFLINVARGEHLVDEDLIYALDKGWMDGACLDVFREEPLDDDHPFWNRKSILITPHAASITPPAEAAEQIVENYKRTLSGMEPKNAVDRRKGY